MPDLEPITRDEMLWSGEDVEPITRREMYIRHLYDETQVIPDKPITREEMFILKAGEELHDVTIEQLNVSENGTYSESGKAYSPVIVDVSLPENAYLLKDIPNTPCDIATFTDGSNLPLASLKTTIVPIQSGSGDPSPTNIRPISGWSGANVTVADDITNKEYFDGLLNGTYGVVDLGSLDWTYYSGSYFVSTNISAKNTLNNVVASAICSIYPIVKAESLSSNDKSCAIGLNGLGVIDIRDTSYTDANTFKTAMSGVHLIYELATPTTPTVTPSEINELYEEFGINGQTYNIQFQDSQGNPIEVFGGECDVVNGGGSAYKEYDSYNGETLIGPWISDRDVYVPNTSPTTGAQVVDMGDTSTFTSQPTSIKSLEGENNVWGDCGKISEGSYFSKGEEE